jgi:hypothetical protein
VAGRKHRIDDARHKPVQFERYIGIDYSGAEMPTSSLPGLRVYAADRTSPAQEVHLGAGLQRMVSR